MVVVRSTRRIGVAGNLDRRLVVFGQDFTDSINPDRISKPYQDTIRAAAWFAEKPWIDRERMAAGGGSYGGFLAATLLGREHPHAVERLAERGRVRVPDFLQPHERQSYGVLGTVKDVSRRTWAFITGGLIAALHALGHTDCREARNGQEGIARLAESPVDMVITDWNMPEMSGLDFLRAVRANDATRHLPVLMVTTNGANGDIADATSAGVTGYIVKPFTPDTIKERIQASLKAV